MTSALLWDDFGVTLGCRYRQAAAVSPLLTVAAAALPPLPEKADTALRIGPSTKVWSNSVPRALCSPVWHHNMTNWSIYRMSQHDKIVQIDSAIAT